MTRRNRRPAANRDLMAVLGLTTPTPELVDAARTRAHVRYLKQAGWGDRSIAARAGVHRSTVRAVTVGRYAGDRPANRVEADTEARILAVRPDEPRPCLTT